jgi:hypothetical protein
MHACMHVGIQTHTKNLEQKKGCRHFIIAIPLEIFFNTNIRVGMVVHFYDLSYSGG